MDSAKFFALFFLALLLCGCVSSPETSITESGSRAVTPMRLAVGEVYEYEFKVNASGNVTTFRMNFTVTDDAVVNGNECFDVAGNLTSQKVLVTTCFNKQNGGVERVVLTGNTSRNEVPQDVAWEFGVPFFESWMLGLNESSHYARNVTRSYPSVFGLFSYSGADKIMLDINFVGRETFLGRDAIKVQRIDREVDFFGDEETVVNSANETVIIDNEKRILLYSEDTNGLIQIELVSAPFKIS